METTQLKNRRSGSHFLSAVGGPGRAATFQAPLSYSSGGFGSQSVAIGDVNGDGNLDLVVGSVCQDKGCSNGYGAVSVLLGNGDGTFQAPVSYSSGGYDGTSVAIADVNGDGRLDVIVANLCYDINCYGYSPGGVSVLLGNGDGTFQAPVIYGSGGDLAYSVAIGDVNGDGYPDLVVANTSCESGSDCEGMVSVLLGNGDGTFQAPYSSGAQGAGFAIGDVNGDGYLDLIVANGSVGVLLGNGDGTFQSPVSYSSGGVSPGFVAIGDVNGDGRPDLIVTNRCTSLNKYGCVGNATVTVLLGNGDGTFQGPVNFNSGVHWVVSLGIGDLNGDGKPDVVAATVSPSVSVLLNTLTATTTIAVTSSPNPSLVNQLVTFTATVSSISLVPDGSVITFYANTAKIGTGTTKNGVATLTTSFSTAKTYSIKASYPGDAFHKASSRTVKQVVNK